MPRLFQSLIAMFLGASTLREPPRPRPRAGVRARRRLAHPSGPSHDGAVEVEERSRRHARVPRFTWEGEAIIETAVQRVVVPGTWTLDLAPHAVSRAHGTDSTRLDLAHPDAWLAQLTRLVTLQVPGSRMHVARSDEAGWQALEVRAPSQPETRVEIDRAGLARLLGGEASVTLRVRG